MSNFLPGVQIQSIQQSSERLSMLLWGLPGTGKTTLAATAPGKKLFLCFDPDGMASIKGFPDVSVANMVGINDALLTKASDDDPFGISKILPDFDTIVLDSITSLAEDSLDMGVRLAPTKNMLRPEQQAYQTRNRVALRMVKGLLSATNKLNKHIIIIGHESTDKDKEGKLLRITINLGGQLPNEVPIKISEVWNIVDLGKTRRRIAIRNSRDREPMKTRMFRTVGNVEFEWDFDPDVYAADPQNYKGGTLNKWFEQWKAANFLKIDLPK